MRVVELMDDMSDEVGPEAGSAGSGQAGRQAGRKAAGRQATGAGQAADGWTQADGHDGQLGTVLECECVISGRHFISLYNSSVLPPFYPLPRPLATTTQLCRAYDAAECCRNVHVDPEWRQAAERVCVKLGGEASG